MSSQQLALLLHQHAGVDEDRRRLLPHALPDDIVQPMSKMGMSPQLSVAAVHPVLQGLRSEQALLEEAMEQQCDSEDKETSGREEAMEWLQRWRQRPTPVYSSEANLVHQLCRWRRLLQRMTAPTDIDALLLGAFETRQSDDEDEDIALIVIGYGLFPDLYEGRTRSNATTIPGTGMMPRRVSDRVLLSRLLNRWRARRVVGAVKTLEKDSLRQAHQDRFERLRGGTTSPAKKTSRQSPRPNSEWWMMQQSLACLRREERQLVERRARLNLSPDQRIALPARWRCVIDTTR